MPTVLAAYGRALHSLGDPRIRRLFWISLALTVLALAGLLALGNWALGPLEEWATALPSWAISIAKIGGAVFVIWLLMPSVLMAVEGFLADDIAAAVEDRDYARDRPGRALGILESLVVSLRLLGLTIVINLIALPLHIAVLWFPVLNLVLVYFVNGYCLSRALIDQIGLRYVRPEELKALRRAGGWSCFLSGVMAAVVLSIPVLNLVAPILATVAGVHVVKAALRARGS
ncbi:EI24 domain-containing protein [Zavarzinia sp. CC-PAN008]|uniref:EI24 domain-containing protein n=1 Tax=Zavarzinia sp. CC-PAN008 TaxID=3243332 RepID=UPI003F74733C